MGVSLLVMFILGFLFWCVLFGLFYAFEKIAFSSEPAYQLFRKALRLQTMPLHFVRPPISRIVYNYISLIFPFIFIFIGVRGFSLIGVCTQNIICILIKSCP